MIFSLFGLAAGIGMPMQTSINAQLGKRVGSPFTAAMINFIVGLVALLIISLIWEHSLMIPVSAIAAAPPWVLMGGMFAVVFVTGNILLMPRLGGVQTVILPALGQIIMGSLIDTFGWFDSAQRDMNPLRILGVVVDSRLFASVVNFSVGLSLLIIINFTLLKTKKPGVKDGRMPLWFLAGGLFGDLFVVGNIITAQTLGTGMAVVILLTGLMIGGLLVDQFGMFRSAKRPVNWKEIAGVAVMVIGAMLFHLA